MFGDRWSLLIIRDLMVRGFRTFKEFQESGEGIATNILADRLHKLEAKGIITAKVEETDGRRVNYRLTEKGIDLAPVLLELLIWGARHEHTGVPCALITKMEKNREEVLAEVRRRWQERDSTPLIPQFGHGGGGRNLSRTRGVG
jgi:DNA-binding HxlR family transcriptional regulator